MKRKQATGNKAPAKRARLSTDNNYQINPRVLQEKVQNLLTFQANLQDRQPAIQDGYTNFDEKEYIIGRAADAIASLISLKAHDRAVATTYVEYPGRIQFDFAIEQRSTHDQSPVPEKKLYEYLDFIQTHLSDSIMDTRCMLKTVRHVVRQCQPVVVRHVQDLANWFREQQPPPNPDSQADFTGKAITKLWEELIFKVALAESTVDEILKGNIFQDGNPDILLLYDMFVSKVMDAGPESKLSEIMELVMFAWYLTNNGKWMLPVSTPASKARDLKRRELIKRVATACESCKGLKDFIFWKQKANTMENMVFQDVSFLIVPVFFHICSDADHVSSIQISDRTTSLPTSRSPTLSASSTTISISSSPSTSRSSSPSTLLLTHPPTTTTMIHPITLIGTHLLHLQDLGTFYPYNSNLYIGTSHHPVCHFCQLYIWKTEERLGSLISEEELPSREQRREEGYKDVYMDKALTAVMKVCSHVLCSKMQRGKARTDAMKVFERGGCGECGGWKVPLTKTECEKWVLGEVESVVEGWVKDLQAEGKKAKGRRR
ncbi:MAG: hypothetical protein Q9220_004126 [cf. Caloplaca sp. 1 TL-2023]